MKNYVYNTEGILSEKLLENFADNLIAVDAIEIYSPCQKLTDKNSDKWTPKYIKKSGCAKKNNRFLRGKNGGKTYKHGTWQACKAEDCKEGEENLNCSGKWGKCNKYCKRKFIIEREASGTGTCPFEKDKEYDCVEPLFNDEIAKGLQGECDFKNIPKEEDKQKDIEESDNEEDKIDASDNEEDKIDASDNEETENGEEISDEKSIKKSNMNLMFIIIIIILILLVISLLFLYR